MLELRRNEQARNRNLGIVIKSRVIKKVRLKEITKRTTIGRKMNSLKLWGKWENQQKRLKRSSQESRKKNLERVAPWKPNKENYPRRKKPSAVSKAVDRSNRKQGPKINF